MRTSWALVLVGMGTVGCAEKDAVDAANNLVSQEAKQAAIGNSAFDDVRSCKGDSGNTPTLWLVLTDAGGPQAAIRLVAIHAKTALQVAKAYDEQKCNVVFFVRPTKESKFGLCTGFDTKQLQLIADGKIDGIKDHAWTLRQLPATGHKETGEKKKLP